MNLNSSSCLHGLDCFMVTTCELTYDEGLFAFKQPQTIVLFDAGIHLFAIYFYVTALIEW